MYDGPTTSPTIAGRDNGEVTISLRRIEMLLDQMEHKGALLYENTISRETPKPTDPRTNLTPGQPPSALVRLERIGNRVENLLTGLSQVLDAVS